jgi:hypothetical protein
MPMGNLELIGNWEPTDKPRGYDKASIGIVTNPKGVEKIKRLWSKVDPYFDVYLLRSPQGYKYTEVGKVEPEFLKDKLGIDITLNPDHVTIVFTNNKGAEKVPMTAWTMAHRFGHAASRGSWNDRGNPFGPFQKKLEHAFTRISQIAYNQTIRSSYGYGAYGDNQRPNQEKVFKHIAQGLGTMKSARDGNLRNYTEFIFELLAQYMITGRCTLNHDLAKILPSRGFAWGKPQGPWLRKLSPELQDELDYTIERLQSDAETYAQVVIGSAVGSVYVM